MALSKFGRKMVSYKGLTLLSAPVAVLVAAGVVMGSSATLSATTDNSNNTWQTHSNQLTLTNDSVSAMFSATNMTAGYTETHCITITNGSDVAATLKAWGTNPQGSPALSDAMDVKIVAGGGGTEDRGTGAGDHCAGFVADATPTIYDGTMTAYNQADYTAGFGSKLLAPGETVQYQVTTTLPANADVTGALNNLSTGMDFHWEIQA